MTSGRMWILAAVLSLAPAFGFTSVAAAPPPKVVQMVIDKATFGDTPSGVFVGDTIEWINKDIFDHTATSKTGALGCRDARRQEGARRDEEGRNLRYFCRYHPTWWAKSWRRNVRSKARGRPQRL